MKISYFVICCFAFLFFSCFASVSAQTGDGWNIGDGWDTGDGFPTPTPYVNPTYFTVFNGLYGSILLASVLPLVIVAAGILLAIKSGIELDPRIIAVMIGLTIMVSIGIAIAIQSANSMQQLLGVN